MTKEEVIKEAYKKLEIPFNENIIYDKGWTKIKPLQYESKYEYLDLLKLTTHVHSIRPKSLQGIENNNGWTKINSEKEIPTDYNKELFKLFYWTNGGIYEAEDYKLWRFHYAHLYITHYRLQPKFNPKPPIY